MIDIASKSAYTESMPKRSSNEGIPEDINILAARIVEGATTNIGDKNLAAVVLGRLGGKKGGKARANKLTPEQRSDIARKATQVRWQKAKDKK